MILVPYIFTNIPNSSTTNLHLNIDFQRFQKELYKINLYTPISLINILYIQNLVALFLDFYSFNQQEVDGI